MYTGSICPFCKFIPKCRFVSKKFDNPRDMDYNDLDLIYFK